MKRLFAFTIIAAVLVFSSNVMAAIVVNEAMVNEPGSNTSLEWIELYNNSSSTGFINSHYLVIGANTITFDSSLRLAPGEYYIIYRKLFGDMSSPGFETVWGNNSGVWGDTPEESAIRIHSQNEVFSLSNSGGQIELYNALDFLVSEINWIDAGSDGVSYEREYPDSNSILQCIDPEGSTPGRVNSVTPVDFDLSLEQIDIQQFGLSTNLFFYIKNRSIDTISGAQLFLFRDPGDTLTTPTDTLEVFNLPDAIPGFTTLVGGNYSLNGVYDTLKAELTDDDRPENNRKIFTAPGNQFPPMIINEYLPNPVNALESEWVEIKNISSVPINLQNWQIGDALAFNTITDSAYYVYPGEYLVLAEDSAGFLSFYSTFNGLLLEPNGWSALNNTGDQIRLKDNFGFVSDSLEYFSAYSDNFSWALAENGVNLGVWGRSQYAGGTPGELNTVVFTAVGEVVSLTITPEHFAPGGDGFDATVDITLEAPEANSYSLRIFDRQGREVRRLLDQEEYFSPSYVWDGRSDGGERLPIGIYIVIFEVSGVQDVKKTVVIAR